MQNAISVKNLYVSYGNIGALTDLSLDIEKGEFLGIIGPNGGGKTTLLSAILGLITPDKGNISIMGESIKDGRILIGYVPQTAAVDRLFPISVTETVLTAFLKNKINPFKKFTDSQKQMAANSLKAVGLFSKADNLISELSGGEFQRLLIARSLVTNPEILLLDEPTSNIDNNSREEIYTLLKELNHEGKTIIMVTHDLQKINSLFTRIVLINRTVGFVGAPNVFFTEGTKND